MPVRVLVWTELFWPYIGGAEVFAARLMEMLRPRGFEFTVVTSHDYVDLPDRDVYRGLSVHRFPFRSVFGAKNIDALFDVRRRAVDCVRRATPDLIHLNGVGASTFHCLEAARATDAPLLVRLNREINVRGSESLTERALAVSAWVAAVSPELLEQVRRFAPGIADKSSVLRSGIDVASSPPGPLPRRPPNILCLGRLVRDKGFDVAIDAFALIAGRVQARMTIAGDGPEGETLRRQVTALGLADQIDFTGFVPPDEVTRVISAATLVVMPSRTDGLPIVGLEAAGMGRPIVASSAGGLPDIVVQGETGFLLDLDAGLFAQAITRLLENPEEAARMGLAAWKRAREMFSLEHCAGEYERVYRRLSRRQTDDRKPA